MSKVIDFQNHKKDNRYDLKDVYGNDLKFDLKPCSHCMGTIVYTRYREIHGPMGIMEGEEVICSLCVKAKWYKPWELFLPKKTLLIKRLNMIKRDVELANRDYKKVEDLKKDLG